MNTVEKLNLLDEKFKSLQILKSSLNSNLNTLITIEESIREIGSQISLYIIQSEIIFDSIKQELELPKGKTL